MPRKNYTSGEEKRALLQRQYSIVSEPCLVEKRESRQSYLGRVRQDLFENRHLLPLCPNLHQIMHSGVKDRSPALLNGGQRIRVRLTGLLRCRMNVGVGGLLDRGGCQKAEQSVPVAVLPAWRTEAQKSFLSVNQHPKQGWFLQPKFRLIIAAREGCLAGFPNGRSACHGSSETAKQGVPMGGPGKRETKRSSGENIDICSKRPFRIPRVC
jgi:hypothetical protein